jgi:hypothetical protein
MLGPILLAVGITDPDEDCTQTRVSGFRLQKGL